MPFSGWNGEVNKLIFTDEHGTPIPVSEDIKMSEIFNPSGVPPSKLQTLSYVRPYSNYVFDWTNTFTSGWVKLTKIDSVCYTGDKYKGYNNLLSNVPNPIVIRESWGKSGLDNVTADYYTMYNWDK